MIAPSAARFCAGVRPSSDGGNFRASDSSGEICTRSDAAAVATAAPDDEEGQAKDGKRKGKHGKVRKKKSMLELMEEEEALQQHALQQHALQQTHVPQTSELTLFLESN